jgi:hypothetical protein
MEASHLQTYPLRVVVLLVLMPGFLPPALADVSFLRGDINLDGTVSIADTVGFECILFCAALPPLPCFDAADVDDDGRLGITDWVALLTGLFLESDTIAPPFPDVGADPTGDDLACERYETTPPELTADVVALGDVTAAPGGMVSVPVLLESAVAVKALQLVVHYDPNAFKPAILRGSEAIRDAYFEGTPFGPQGSSNNRTAFLGVAATPETGMLFLGFDPGFGDLVTIPPTDQPIRVLNLVGEVLGNANPGEVIKLAFAEQTAPFGPVRTELVALESSNPPARLPGTLRSGTITIVSQDLFVRGDSNLDGEVNISDAIHMLGYLFLGAGEYLCRDAADVNDDGQNDLSDSVGLLSFLFLGGSPPRFPWPSCGTDPGSVHLGCESSSQCMPGDGP